MPETKVDAAKYKWVDYIWGSYLQHPDKYLQHPDNPPARTGLARVYVRATDRRWCWEVGDTTSDASYLSRDDAKAACEKALGITTDPKPSQEDQPEVLVPGSDEDVKEARKRIWGERMNEAEDAEARHASAMVEEIDYGMVSQILLQAGYAIPAWKLQLAVELARVAS